MKKALYAVGPCLLLPPVCFLMLAYPVIKGEIQAKIPLLTPYYLSRQLAAEVTFAEAHSYGLPPVYRRILEDYGSLPADSNLMELGSSGTPGKDLGLAGRMLARFMLRRAHLPSDLLEADPAREIVGGVALVARKNNLAIAERESLIRRHVLECLRFNPPVPLKSHKPRRGMPPDVTETSLVFCGERIPLVRPDVLLRISHQIDYLIGDFRTSTGMWLRRKDRYGTAIAGVLREEGLPEEFSLLPALESGFSSAVTSPAMALGWWQFVKPTARLSQTSHADLNWKLRVDDWKDERKDLTVSTRSAAKYLKWIRLKLGDRTTPASWLVTAAAYNAGLTETRRRMRAYGTPSYWDIKLPRETEDYVPRWIALFVIDTHRKHYGFEVPKIDALRFDTLEGIQLSRDLPLSLLATVTGASVRFIREINGSLDGKSRVFRAVKDNRVLTHTIHVPEGCKDLVLETLKSLSFLKSGT
jgi:membrane-bound lytic murein transglycosylase D